MDFPGHFDQIFQQLNSQRLHGQLCDCVIVVGSRHFKAHRSVLAACSTHFRALFTVTEGEGSMNMIQLDSEVVTAEAFAALVDMMYTSTLMLGESNVMDVLLAASHLHLNAVVKACKHYLTTRTLPMTPPGDRTPHHHHADQQQQGPSAGSNSRLQRSFLLPQLGLSLANSALGGMEEAGEAGRGGSVEQRASFPIRRFHKRKASSSLMTPEDRHRQRLRPLLDPEGPLIVRVSGGDGELLSLDSLKTGNEPKAEKAVDEQKYGGGAATKEDAQVPSQSDGGRDGERTPLGHGSGKEEPGDGVVVKMKEGAEEEEPPQHMRVVVKTEPMSSPELVDETSDITSQAEGSDQAEPGADKIELSPESSDRSFSDPQSSTDRVGEARLAEEGAGREGIGDAVGRRGSGGGALMGRDGPDRKQGFSISSFLCSKGFGKPGSLSVGDDSLPNTTTVECRLDAEAGGFLQSPEALHAPSSSVVQPGSHHSHQHFLSGEPHPFGDINPEALFLRPVEDGLGYRRVGADQFALDFQRSSLGLHSLARSSRGGGGGGGVSVGYPGYRRIAPKMPPDGGGGSPHVDSAQLPEASSSSGTPGGAVLLNGVAYEGMGRMRGAPQTAPPQLTRASADVLSKCKKALSEHNVLVVEGARKYACKICCKTFLTLTDCKKHIRVHTGEKPYACLKCGKRFSQSSHLYKHSKTTCLRWQNNNLQSSLL